jgi:hypothetical protein
MMLAVATATGREASVRILREREHRRNHGKREGREQQDGQKASHRILTVPVYGFDRHRVREASGCCADSVKYYGVVV